MTDFSDTYSVTYKLNGCSGGRWTLPFTSATFWAETLNTMPQYTDICILRHSTEVYQPRSEEIVYG